MATRLNPAQQASKMQPLPLPLSHRPWKMGELLSRKPPEHSRIRRRKSTRCSTVRAGSGYVNSLQNKIKEKA